MFSMWLRRTRHSKKILDVSSRKLASFLHFAHPFRESVAQDALQVEAARSSSIQASKKQPLGGQGPKMSFGDVF